MIFSIHKPIMVKEIISQINLNNNNFFLDATFGGGGHTKKLISSGCKVLALDNYSESKKIASNLNLPNNQFSFYKSNFSNIDEVLKKNNIQDKFDGVLLDLGFSSNQLEDDKIGLSFKKDVPLNMNYADFDISACTIVNEYNEKELTRIFQEYGEISNANKLAKFIIFSRQKNRILTTFQFIDILSKSKVNFGSKKTNFATKPFQALRIEANKELENLSIFLKKICKYLNQNALIFVISFHSLEDRIVKQFFKHNSINKDVSFKENQMWGFQIITKRPIKPSRSEILDNPRARSAKLRIARYKC